MYEKATFASAWVHMYMSKRSANPNLLLLNLIHTLTRPLGDLWGHSSHLIDRTNRTPLTNICHLPAFTSVQCFNPGRKRCTELKEDGIPHFQAGIRAHQQRLDVLQPKVDRHLQHEPGSMLFPNWTDQRTALQLLASLADQGSDTDELERLLKGLGARLDELVERYGLV